MLINRKASIQTWCSSEAGLCTLQYASKAAVTSCANCVDPKGFLLKLIAKAVAPTMPECSSWIAIKDNLSGCYSVSKSFSGASQRLISDLSDLFSVFYQTPSHGLIRSVIQSQGYISGVQELISHYE